MQKLTTLFCVSYLSIFCFAQKQAKAFFFISAVADIVQYVSTIKIRCWSKINFIRHQRTQLYSEQQITALPGEISCRLSL